MLGHSDILGVAKCANTYRPITAVTTITIDNKYKSKTDQNYLCLHEMTTNYVNTPLIVLFCLDIVFYNARFLYDINVFITIIT